MKKLILGLFSVGLGLIPHICSSQDFDCLLEMPPFEVNGIKVNQLLGENTESPLLGNPISICLDTNYYCHPPWVWLGVSSNSFGTDYNPFEYTLEFSKSVKSVSFILLVGSTPWDSIDYGAENFVFTSPICGLTINDIYSCHTLIQGDTIYLGVGGVGTGWFSVTFDEPVLEFTISGKGGGNGSGFQICSNSIEVAPLWASISAPEQVCAQDSVLFTGYAAVVESHPPPYTFSYALNGVVQSVSSTVSSDSAWLPTPQEPGTYTYELLSVTAANGSSVNITCNNTRTVVVEPPPTAQFTVSPSAGFAPLHVITENQSTNATQYEWFLNESGGFDSAQPPVSLSEAPTFNLQAPGSYEITLVATSALGCTDTTTQTVHVLEDFQVTIPNIFTPNNDGANDLFGITTNIATRAHLTVLNRWGNPVFEKAFITQTTGFQELWDGTSTSSGIITNPSSGTVPEGVYFYKLKLYYSTTSEEYEEFVGFVTVER